MKDDFLSREWADTHRTFADNIAALLQCVGTALAYLNTYEFDAPWRHTKTSDRAR